MLKSLRLPSDSIWRNPHYVLFWSGRSISILGTVISQVLLPILVYRLTNSAFQTSFLVVFEVLPYLCFGLFAGALADRINRKRLMVGCDLVNMLLLGSIPVSGAFHMLTITQIYLVGLLSATAFVWFDAANFGALPALVGREYIVTANSYITATESFLLIIGPSLAGLLAAFLSPALAISFDAASYACSAVSLLLITRAFNSALSQESARASIIRKTFKDIRDGLDFLVHQHLVRTMTLLGFGNSFTGGAVMSLLVVYGVKVLGLGKNDIRIGLLFTAGATGSLLASLFLPILIRHMAVGRITLIALSLAPLLLIGVALAPGLIIGLSFLRAWDICYTLTIINGISLRQLVTPDHLQSRVNATARMIAWGGAPFGAAVGGFLAERTAISTTYIIMACGVGISAILGWFSPLRKMNQSSLHRSD